MQPARDIETTQTVQSLIGLSENRWSRLSVCAAPGQAGGAADRSPFRVGARDGKHAPSMGDPGAPAPNPRGTEFARTAQEAVDERIRSCRTTRCDSCRGRIPGARDRLNRAIAIAHERPRIGRDGSVSLPRLVVDVRSRSACGQGPVAWRTDRSQIGVAGQRRAGDRWRIADEESIRVPGACRGVPHPRGANAG